MSEPQVKKSKTVSSLDQLKALTTIVADTGDFEGMWKMWPFLYWNGSMNLAWKQSKSWYRKKITTTSPFGIPNVSNDIANKNSIPFEYMTVVRMCVTYEVKM